MKQKAIVVSCYAFLLLIGGFIGYKVAHSLISLVVSGLFAAALLVCSAKIWKGSLQAYQIAMTLTLCLFVFFSYRFFLSYKFMPGGMMALISGALSAYLFMAKKQFSKLLQSD